MKPSEIAELRAKLLNTIPQDSNTAIGLADRIQKVSRDHPELTLLCEYHQAQRMRRLIALPLKAWGILEARWAAEALEKIADLSRREGLEAALALACYGIQRADLENAFRALGKPAPTKKSAAKPKAKQEIVAEVNDDEEFDSETQAELDALMREVQSLKKS